MAHGYRKGGWREKYFIAKRILDEAGRFTGIRFTEPDAQYFVLRYDMDPHARIAMRAYAESVHSVNPQLALDIMGQLEATSETEGGRLEREGVN